MSGACFGIDGLSNDSGRDSWLPTRNKSLNSVCMVGFYYYEVSLLSALGIVGVVLSLT
jgi:hypothetical protein